MGKFLDFLYTKCVIIMMFGFILSIVGITVFMRTRFYGNAIPQIAAASAIAGFVIYIIGRIFMATRKRYLQTKNTTGHTEKDNR